MANPPNKSASKNDFLKSPYGTNNCKLTNKEIREQYFTQLRLWLGTVNSYQCYYNKLQQEFLQKNYQQVLKNAKEVPKVVPNVHPETPTAEPETPTVEPETPTVEPETPNVATNQFVGIKCKIPSLWKRFGAEIIDFILLSLVKFLIAYFFLEYVLEIDFKKYNSIFTQDDYNNVDYTTAIEMSSELFVIEVMHRIIVCVYEIYFLQGRTFYFQRGVTVGKFLLDLSVVRADQIFSIRNQPTNVIALTPGGDIGWRLAIFRSITKNLFFAFVFPLPFITAVANQNRCAYDVLGNTIVVEVIRPFRCEQSQLILIG